MTKSVDFNELKNKTAEFSKRWKKKLGYLSENVSRSGMEGAQYWLKSHHQIDDFNEAISELNKTCDDEEFRLLHVHTTFSSFVLPEEDMGQAEWYLAAHNILEQIEKQISTDKTVNIQLLQSALKELKFISEANEFHERYKIEAIQAKVTQLYQSLQKSLTEFKALEKEKINSEKEKEKTKVAELEKQKAEALAKKAMLENVKIKEKRLAIAEEKKRKIAEKEAIEAQQIMQREEAEVKAKQAEIDRQSKLQEAYIDLQVEEKISGWELSILIEKITSKLANEELDQTQKQTLIAFIDKTKEKI